MPMGGWTMELKWSLARASTQEVAVEAIGLAVQQIGFEHFAYGLRWPQSFTRPRTLMVSSYPRHWQQRYLEAGYVAQDPTVAHGLRSCAPLVWSDDVFATAPSLWREAQAAGLRAGWCQSCFDADGCAGLFTVARGGEPIGRKELARADPELRWLANTVHLGLGSLVRRAEGLQVAALTRRQLEVLRWSADGKTCVEIAQILLVTPDTVNYHLQMAMTRLGAPNKMALVARAAKLGLLG
jgi:LuxR family transcriptional regulator